MMEESRIHEVIKELRKKLDVTGEVLLYLDDETRNRKHDYTDVLDYLYMQIDNREQWLDEIREAALDKTSGRGRVRGRTRGFRLGLKTPNQLMAEIETLDEMVDAVKNSTAELYLYVPGSQELGQKAKLYEVLFDKDEISTEIGYALSVSVEKGQVSLKLQRAAERKASVETYRYRDAVADKELGRIHIFPKESWVWDNEVNEGCSWEEFDVFNALHDSAPIEIANGIEAMIGTIDSKKINWYPFTRQLMILDDNMVEDAQAEINKIIKEYRPVCCKDCGRIFILPDYEAEWYTRKGLTLPKRCKPCRNKRAEQKFMEQQDQF